MNRLFFLPLKSTFDLPLDKKLHEQRINYPFYFTGRMKLISSALVTGIIFLLCPSFLSAQIPSDYTITANYQGQSVTAVLQDIESKLPLQFYYKDNELPNKSITATFEESALEDVLYELLRETSLGYIPYRDYAIVIAPQTIVEESYSADYYQALEENLNQDENSRTNKRTIVIGDFKQLSPSGKAKITGQIIDEQTNEPIIGATLLWSELNVGTATDYDGNFETEIPTGEYEVLVQYIGYSDLLKKVKVYSDGTFDIPLSKAAIDLEAVVVSAQAVDANVENVQIGVERLDAATIKKTPTFLGEADVVKTLLLNPGVSSIGEGATGFNVRGGNVDQNLILQDEGFIFNASHALGFFSTFNADLIRSVQLYKGNIPAQFGGRLASVLDVELRDGNFEQFKIKGGAGPVSSRISVEGPVIKEKSSFLAGFRSTYSDWVLQLINVEEVKRSSAFFYDANLKYTHRLNKKNTLTLSGYSSQDDFVYNQQFGFDYATWMGQLSFNTIFNDQFYNKFSLTTSNYTSTQTDLDPTTGANLTNEINYYKVKDVVTRDLDNGMKLDIGASAILYNSLPGERTPFGELSTVIPKRLEEERGIESAAFANIEYEVGPRLLASGGLRYSFYQFLGNKTIYEYQDEDPTGGVDNIIGTSERSGVIASYGNLEPRLSLRYKLDPAKSLKMGYSRTAQYVNQIYNSDTPTPTNQFQLSTNYIAPQRSHNFSIGYFQNLSDNNIETSIEVFGRVIDDAFDYKDFASLIVNDHLETELLSGEGRAAGVELSFKKKRGTVNGWLSYTLSRSERRIEGINKNDWYRSNFDKPHDVSLVLNYNPNQRHTITVNFNYSTGRPATPPLGNYVTDRGLAVPVYAERNQVRIPDYHRMDIAYTIGQGYRKTAKVKTSWTLSLYNVYGRRNAFSVFYTPGAFNIPEANKLAILGSVFPAITFNLEIL